MTLDELVAALTEALKAEKLTIAEFVELVGDGGGTFKEPIIVLRRLKPSKLEDAIARVAKRLVQP